MQPRSHSGSTLTREEVLRLNNEASAAGQKLELCGYDLSGVNLGGADLTLRNVVFGRPHDPTSAAKLNGAVFGGSQLEDCKFVHADLVNADFRGCFIRRCDFRNAIFRYTTLGDATLVLCDLYRASIEEGTVMLNTVFELVSLKAATLDGATGLRWTSFAARGRPPALVTESEPDYRDFLEWTREDRPKTRPIGLAVRERLDDAAQSYRDLCGLWTSRAQFRDAGQAYAHSRRLERQSLGPRFRGRRFRPRLLWFWLWLADLLCGFGESLGRIICWLVVVAVLPGAMYWLFGGVHGARGIFDDFLFSASQLTGSTPARLTSASHLADWVRVVQTLMGIGLLGLFGFVLGQKIRNS